jgi:hypothetical protein
MQASDDGFVSSRSGGGIFATLWNVQKVFGNRRRIEDSTGVLMSTEAFKTEASV